MASLFERSHRALAIAALLGLAAWTPICAAATFRVGIGPNCTHSTVAAAVAASEGSAGPDTIRVTRSAAYTAQAISFTVTQEVTITGGYADCNTHVNDGTYTTLDGTGGSNASVMTITGGTGSIVHLSKLLITGGDVNSVNASLGGGITYTGNGLLDIASSRINLNVGAYGGGVNVTGTGTGAELDIGSHTALYGNTAYYNGGGLYSNNIKTKISGDGIYIDTNTATGVTTGSITAGGYGGGIHIRACELDSTVYVGAANNGAGVVTSNTARYGGGISIEGVQGCSSSGDAKLRLYSTETNRSAGIKFNQASIAGGGVYASPNAGSQNSADADFWNAAIDGNTAPTGSALYLGADGTGYQSNASFNDTAAPTGGIPCVPGGNCGEILGNFSSSGPVVEGERNNDVYLYRMVVVANQGTELIHLESLYSANNLFAGNTTSARLIEGNFLRIVDSTIAGNTIGGAEVLGTDVNGNTQISGSIIWQPGKPARYNSANAPFVTDVLSSDAASLSGLSTLRLVVADPRFVDTTRDDYSLTAGSPAVDFAAPVVPYPVDLLSNPREIDLDIVANRYGPRDIGAFERQSLQPLVLNSNFDANDYSWPEVTVGASSWDSGQNAPGTPAGGALHVSVNGNSISARKQCIHLPGPGTYTLNGWGKSTGTIVAGSYVSLGWEYRSAGSETCTGTVTASGSLLLANHDTWRKPATPASIPVPDAEWTRDSSILVYLVVTDGNGGVGGQAKAPSATLNGWFDGITLNVLSDSIFANGFE